MRKVLQADEQLQRWVEDISRTEFGKPFIHKAYYNPRLRTTGGRYVLRTHHLEFNPAQLQIHGEEEFKRIIRHELCHYHLHLAGKGYRHRDPEFKALLAQVGGARYCKALPSKQRTQQPIRYVLDCIDCGMQYPRKKRMDPSRYRCGKCHGQLQLRNRDESML